jgi:hypothetical protein
MHTQDITPADYARASANDNSRRVKSLEKRFGDLLRVIEGFNGAYVKLDERVRALEQRLDMQESYEREQAERR